jgi:hypothetical protein
MSGHEVCDAYVLERSNTGIVGSNLYCVVLLQWTDPPSKESFQNV